MSQVTWAGTPLIDENTEQQFSNTAKKTLSIGIVTVFYLNKLSAVNCRKREVKSLYCDFDLHTDHLPHLSAVGLL